MRDKNPLFFLNDINESLERILEYTNKLTLEEFLLGNL